MLLKQDKNPIKDLFTINLQDCLYFLAHKQSLIPYLINNSITLINTVLTDRITQKKEVFYSLKATILDKLGTYESHDVYFISSKYILSRVLQQLLTSSSNEFASLILPKELKAISKYFLKNGRVNRFLVPNHVLTASTLEDFDHIITSYIPLFDGANRAKALEHLHNSYMLFADYSLVNTVKIKTDFLKYAKQELGLKILVFLRDILSLFNLEAWQFIDIAILPARVSYVPYAGFFVFVRRDLDTRSFSLLKPDEELFSLSAFSVVLDNVRSELMTIRAMREKLNRLFINTLDEFINTDVTNPLLVPLNIISSPNDRFITVLSLPAEFGDYLKRNARHSRVFIDVFTVGKKDFRFAFSLGLYNNEEDVKDLVEYLRTSAHMLGLV